VLTLIVIGMIAMPIIRTCSLLYISLTSTGSVVVLPIFVVRIRLSAKAKSAMDLTGLFGLAFEALEVASGFPSRRLLLPVVDSGRAVSLKTKAALTSKADATVGLIGGGR
jgi:hypothetical protein